MEIEDSPKPDLQTRFVYENRPLGDWLLQLIDKDASSRKAAAKVVSERFYMPMELLPDSSEGVTEFLAQFAVAVRCAVNEPRFPAATYVVELLSLELALHESWCQMNREDFKREDEFDKLELAKLEENPTEAAKSRYVRRLWVRTLRECKRISEEEPHEIMTTGMALVRVIESLGKELLPATDVLREMMESRGKANMAFEAIGRMGRDGLVFYDELLARLKRDDPNYHSPRALGALLQSAPEKIQRILRLASDSDARLRINAIHTLGYVGRKGTASFPEVEVQLRGQLAHCADLGEWHALVFALSEIAQEPATVELLLGFLNQADKQGPVITALGKIGKEPESVLPPLIELMDTFEEYDPDECYHGEHERIVQALRGFGPASAIAVPTLIRHIWTRPQQFWTKEKKLAERPEPDEEVIRFLGELGGLAKASLPALLEVQAEEKRRCAESSEQEADVGSTPEESTVCDDTYVDVAIKQIRQEPR